MIVAIDGPAGAGKSSVARALAERLGFQFLDTGAMYRSVAWAALDRGIGFDDPDRLVQLARDMMIEPQGDRIFVDGQDASEAIRTVEVTRVTRHAADHPGVREILVDLQRSVGETTDVVTEGRDQGTVAFPHAEVKIFLTATPETRAERRRHDLLNRGEDVPVEEILTDQERRDAEDRAREVGGLKRAADAVEFLTDGLTKDQVVDRLEQIVRDRG
ncbi:MAG: (d)CMP kinase [Planctomycetales bacterium]